MTRPRGAGGTSPTEEAKEIAEDPGAGPSHKLRKMDPEVDLRTLADSGPDHVETKTCDRLDRGSELLAGDLDPKATLYIKTGPNRVAHVHHGCPHLRKTDMRGRPAGTEWDDTPVCRTCRILRKRDDEGTGGARA